MAETNEKWLAVEITVDPRSAEAIEFALDQTGALGTEINLFGIGESPSETVVIGYFNKKPDAAMLRFEIADALRIYGFGQSSLKSLDWREVENRDWLAEWKKHWKPTETGRFIIAPPWENVDAPDKVVISIEPNMAFGTGTHETTQLCLRAIGDHYRAGQTLLDVGTGTGILAIAAAKLAAEKDSTFPPAKILACDTDTDSVRIARENAAANGVEAYVEFLNGSIDYSTQNFDFVCANLTIDVIVPILPLLLAKSGSALLLSGILEQQEHLVVNELRKCGISDFQTGRLGEWISILVNFD